MRKVLITASCILSMALLNGCAVYNNIFGDDAPKPAPLVNFSPTMQSQQQWSTSVGNGAGDQYLNLIPALNNGVLYVASHDGKVSAINQNTGHVQWSVNTNYVLDSGVGVSNNAVFIGGNEGEVIALNRNNGSTLWVSRVRGEVLAAPVVANNYVLVKSEDGVLTAFDANSGNNLWSYPQANPSLILRVSSAPAVSGNVVVAGFAKGNLAGLNLENGRPLWQTQLAQPQGFSSVEQMIDIAGTPQILGSIVYAGTYQGQIAALDLHSGRILWSRDFSTYTDLAVGNNTVYAADMEGHISAFNRVNGALLWKQDALTRRYVTAPVIMGNTIVVGDVEGYLHWMSSASGNFVARTQVNKNGISVKPLVQQNWLYTYTNNGTFAAYTLQ